MDIIKTHHRILLVFILSLFLFGLAAHSLPGMSLCACLDSADNVGNASPADACLVCLLQGGVYNAGLQSLTISSCLLPMGELSGPNPLKHALQITHPPTLA